MGGVRQQAEIFGANTFTGFPAETTGLLAGPNNSGMFERGKFAVSYELTLNLGYFVTDHCRVHVGHNFLWFSSALRPAQVIDPVVNDSGVRFVASPPMDPVNTRPFFNFAQFADDFFAQGIQWGVTVVY